MRFLNANYIIGIGIVGLALTLSLETQAQSMDEAAATGFI